MPGNRVTGPGFRSEPIGKSEEIRRNLAQEVIQVKLIFFFFGDRN